MNERDETTRWLVYVMERVFDARFATQDQAVARIEDRWAGRVTRTSVVHDPSSQMPWVVWVWRYNVHGHYKDHRRAQAAAAALREQLIEPDVKVVAEGSRQERELQMYGKVKMR